MELSFSPYQRFTIFLLSLVLLIGIACNQKQDESILIAVASNSQFAIEEIIKEFNKTNQIQIKTSTGSSGKLCAHILQGAPFDLFVSADTIYSEKILAEGKSSGKPKIYAEGKLVLWALNDMKDLTPEKLSSPEIKYIALANPKTAPYGKAALEFLQYYKLNETLEEKLVFAESIGQVSQMLHSGAADIAITARSIVASEKMKNRGYWVEIPESSYSPINQSAVLILQNGNSSEKAQRFFNFLFSERSREIFLNHGYKLPGI